MLAARTEVVGPLLWEPPFEGDAEPPPGVDRSCSSRRRHPRIPTTACCAALGGLADLPVRVLATTDRRPLREPSTVPANARVVDWLSYARTMPRCDVVVCHGGHGTVARALRPARRRRDPSAGDMAENAARIDWADVGFRVPRRMCTPRAIGLAVGRRLRSPGSAAGAEVSAWAATHDAPERAAGWWSVRARLTGKVRGSRGPNPAAPGTSLGR